MTTTLDSLNAMLDNITKTLRAVRSAVHNGLPYFEETPWPGHVSPESDGYLADEEGRLWPSEDDALHVSDYEGGVDPHEFLVEYVLDVVDERGRPFAVVISTGGPHIEIEAEGGGQARLVGYWGGKTCERWDSDLFGEVLDYFVDRD